MKSLLIQDLENKAKKATATDQVELLAQQAIDRRKNGRSPASRSNYIDPETGRNYSAQEYKEWAQREAQAAHRKYGVPVDWIFQTESSYRYLPKPNSAGAVTIAQAMPDTAAKYGYRVEDLHNPRKAAEFIGRYISTIRRQIVAEAPSLSAEEATALAMFSYNSGERHMYNAIRRSARSLGREPNYAEIKKQYMTAGKPRQTKKGGVSYHGGRSPKAIEESRKYGELLKRSHERTSRRLRRRPRRQPVQQEPEEPVNNQELILR